LNPCAWIRRLTTPTTTTSTSTTTTVEVSTTTTTLASTVPHTLQIVFDGHGPFESAPNLGDRTSETVAP
jgi:hypothetical protein